MPGPSSAAMTAAGERRVERGSPQLSLDDLERPTRNKLCTIEVPSCVVGNHECAGEFPAQGDRSTGHGTTDSATAPLGATTNVWSVRPVPPTVTVSDLLPVAELIRTE